VNPRSEPLLWLQLIAIGAIPLELLLLLLILAGADPGPLPALERLLVWGLGALAPAVLLWRRPADCCSLLLVQVPLAARSPGQRRLMAQQEVLPAKLLMLAGAALLLPLLWTVDRHAALAGPLSPLEGGNRLVSLLLAIPLLALLLWQWQQLLQSLWLLARPADDPAADQAQKQQLDSRMLDSQRLSLGMPLLLLSPLAFEPSSRSEPALESPQTAASSVGGDPLPVEPEQSPEQDQGDDLDQEVS
jgi:hypothetical protein